MAGGKGGPGRLLRHGPVRRATLPLASAMVPGPGTAAPRRGLVRGGAQRAARTPRADQPAAVAGLADGAPRRLHRDSAALADVVDGAGELGGRGAGSVEALPLL